MRSTSVYNTLRRATTLLRKGWCKRSLAETASGDQCAPRDKDAAKYCAVGAVLAAETNRESAKKAIGLLNNCCGFKIVYFNDSQETVKPVIEVFKKAMNEARRKGL